MSIGIMIQFFFIFFPCAAGNNYRMTGAKARNHRQRFKRFGNIYYPVKTGISAYEHRLSDAQGIEQLPGLFILNKKSMKTIQHQTVDIPVPFKKGLIYAEKR